MPNDKTSARSILYRKSGIVSLQKYTITESFLEYFKQKKNPLKLILHGIVMLQNQTIQEDFLFSFVVHKDRIIPAPFYINIT